ncbi:hypothetical protein B9T31_08650 [Acinetobacter sp. ANC 4558]|uniref:hypothetical protein n=1 Tax=Acinetobacter sp. ANC 4558 TaxID=1977876 RepID=UPI000A347786|nr:hypothetical protein [Acinetobacter sp. ANC 4558]OTG86101.1 hypothetical protein B9T31_08650 [Acinetobacter sp. ANC 4558]
MDKYLIVALVVLFCIILVVYTQKGSTTVQRAKSLKERVQSAFPTFQVIEKFNTIIISGKNQRNEQEEFVTIRIDENQQKNMRLYGRMLIATYPKEPSDREMKQDFLLHLQQN